MQKKRQLMIALALTSATSLSWAECVRPDRPAVPNGSEATMEEMIAGQTAVKAYVAEGNTFTDCLNAQEKAASAAINTDDEEAVAAFNVENAKRVETHNSMVDEMQAVAAEWKESMTTFKAKSSDG